MAVIPQSSPDPFQWARDNAKTNDQLYMLFLKQREAEQAADMQQQNSMQDREFAVMDTRARDDAGYDYARERDASQQANQQSMLDKQLAAGYGQGRGKRGRSGVGSDEDPLAPHRAAFRNVEAEKKLPEGYLDAVAEIESASGRNVTSKTSSARGPFQFLKETAKQMNLTNPHDPVQSGIAAGELARQGGEKLRQLTGREPTGEDLYLMHQQGQGGAAKLLSNPDARAVDLIGLQAVLNNGGSITTSAKQFADMIRGKYTNANTMWQSRRDQSDDIVADNADGTTQTADAAPAQPATQSGTPPQAAGGGAPNVATPPAASGQQQSATTTPKPSNVKVSKIIGPDGKPRFALVEK